jgi:uncharacterized protein YhfF
MNIEDLPTVELAFPGPLRDSGVSAVLSGEKTALTALLQILERAQEAVPKRGDRFSVLDSAGQCAAIIELTDVEVVRMCDIDDDYAHAEGRGYADALEWRQAHEDFFQSEEVTEFLGVTAIINDETLVVMERFRVIESSSSAPL